MDPMAWGVVGSRAGATVGVLGAVLAQHVAHRHADHLAAREWEIRRETEWRAARAEFTEAAERGLAACGRADEIKADAGARMWASGRRLVSLSTGALRDATHAYADRINEALWQELPRAAWEHSQAESRLFDQAAEEEATRRWPRI